MVRPLTKHDKEGNRYVRPPKIEAMTEAALAQDLPTLLRRAELSEREAEGYLPSECLVSLIRDAIRRDDQASIEGLLPVLLARCEANLKAKVPDAMYADANGLREEILGEFALVIALDGTDENPDELDYFECKFNSAFSCFRIDMLRKEDVRTKPLVPLPTGPDRTDGEAVEWMSNALQAAATQDHGLRYQELLSGIEALPSDERRAVVMCCMMGFEEESIDPAKTTAATLCGVTGRTIRNRLCRAAEKLSRFQEQL